MPILDVEKSKSIVVLKRSMNAGFAGLDNDIFYNEEKYTFLEKIYDTKDMNFDYHVKIFEINYEEFEKAMNSSDNTYTNLLE